MNRTILGLDMGNSSLSAVVIEKPLKGFSIKESLSISYDDLETKESPDNSETYPSLFEQALSTLLEKIDCKGLSSVALVIPSSEVSFRNITLPFRSLKKIRQVLEFELAAHLPLADETYVSDFTRQKDEGKEDCVTLLTASIPDSFLDTCFNHLKAVGLKPGLITVQGYITADHFPWHDEGDSLWLDQAEDHTTLCLKADKDIVKVRTLGGDLPPYDLAQAIHQTIEGENQRSGKIFSPQVCIITSSGKKSEALCFPLEKALGYPVSLAENNDETTFPPYLNALSAALAHGASRPVLNFCQGKYSEDSILKRHKTSFALLFIFAAMAFSSFLFSVHTDIRYLEKNASELELASLAMFKKSFPNAQRIVDPLMQIKVELKQLKETSGLSADKEAPIQGALNGCIEILAELSNRIPLSVDIETTRFILNPGRILLSGSTANFNDVDRIKGLLEKSVFFKQVEIQNAAAEKTGKRVRFQFIITT